MKRNLKITAFLLCCTLSLHAQINIFEPCTGNAAVTNVELIGNAYFTGNGSTDPIGSGYLRLTDATNNQAGGAYINQAFPSIMGVVVEFDYLCWKPVNGLMADGASVFLFDGDYGPTSSPPFALGYLGGGLGYAEIGTPGLTGGYIAVGLDEYGTWNEQANPYDVTAPNVHSPNISIRGRTADHTPYLDGILMSSQSFTLEYPIVPTARPLPSVYYRKVQVAITYNAAISKYQVVVSIQREGGSLETIIGPYTMNDAPPPTLKVGLAASTGALNAVHELRNLRITTPGDVRVEKTGTAKVDNGQAATYTVKVYNDAPSDLSGITLTDILPAGFIPYSGTPTFSNGGNANNTLVSGAYSGNTYTAQMNIENNSYCTFNFNGYFNISGIPGGDTLTVKNSATVSTAAGYTDGDPSNNTAEVITKVFQTKLEVCANDSITFEAETTLGGISPMFQWQINGINQVGKTDSVFTFLPDSGDVVSCLLISNENCANPDTVISQIIVVTTKARTDSTFIYANDTVSICSNAPLVLSVSTNLLRIPDPVYRWYDSQTSNIILFEGSNFTPPSLTTSRSYFVSIHDSSGVFCENKKGNRKEIKVVVTPKTTPTIRIKVLH